MQKKNQRPNELKDLVDLFNEMTDGRKRDYERSEHDKPPPPATPPKPDIEKEN